MTKDEVPPAAVEHVFTQEDRLRQLATLERLCDQLATILVQHGERFEGQEFCTRAKSAQRLLSDGYSREDLNSLGGQFPDGPWWLNPRAEADLVPWQRQVAELHSQASEAASELRAVATLG